MMRIIYPKGEYSHADVATHVNRLAHALAQQLTSNDEVVAVLLDGSVHGVLLLLAAISCNKTIAICPAREPHATIIDWATRLKAKVIFSSCAMFSGDAPINQVRVEDMLAQTSVNKDCPDVLFENNFSTLMRTSGTTGIPKNAMISGRAHVYSARAVNDYFSFGPDDIWALSLPLHHVSGFSVIMRALQARASIFVAAGDDLAYALERGAITHVSLVPTQLKRLLDDNINLQNVKKIILGGDAVPEKLRARALEKNLPIYETYGLTETASMIWVRNAATKISCVLSHARMTHSDEGEILVGGESLFEGYCSDPKTVSRNAPNGWFATGDVGVINDDNQLQLISRKSHRIIAGGENVQAEEIERVLENHPAIEECVVVGVADDDLGMRPIAYIKWLNAPIDSMALANFVREHLSPIHVPKYFLSWPSDLNASLKKPRTLLANHSANLA